MKVSQHLPHNTIPIYTYEELDSFADQYADGAYALLVVIGGHGLGKSQAFRTRLRKRAHGIVDGGTNTPFQVYPQLYKHKDVPIVFEDADGFFMDRKTKGLMVSMCETTVDGAARTVTYRSREIERLGLPTSFKTTSNIVIVCNEWQSALNAVADRGVILSFRPSVYDVHEQVLKGCWLKDRWVAAFMEDHLHLVTEPSMRYYIIAHQMRKAGRKDWKTLTLKMIQPDKRNMEHVAVISQLLDDENMSKSERVRQFKETTGSSQATFYRYARKLAQARGVH